MASRTGTRQEPQAKQPAKSSEKTSGSGTVMTNGDAMVVEAARRAGEAAGKAIGQLPEPMRLPSTSFASELNSIDFAKMIGGPLQAAVDAQVASAMATVSFIKEVGFTPVPKDAAPGTKPELVMVDMSHRRVDGTKPDGTPDVKEVQLRVPLIAMLPIPSLRIEQVVIDFNVKLNSVESASVEDQLGINAEASGGWGPVKFKVSASYQRKTTTNVEVKKEYALNVNVKAVQDEIPAGLEKCLNMLSA